ncbi:tyrosine-type recombinase/integrase [Streptomyces sp. NPDC059568]|uniref:tyrosine-type recombinase/integrase n=1 Tax=Streptomyces sp. NPDC059568 TaxID=3346868 RepID=UPI0036776A12
MADPIKKIALGDGTVRYRFVIDVGKDPQTGKRKQLTVTKDTRTEAEAEHSRIKYQRSQGTFVAPSKMTVGQLVDVWLKEATKDVELATKRSYEDAMRYVRVRLGKKPAQELNEEDVDALITWMLTEARRIGGKPGTGLSVRTCELTLGRLRSVLSLGIRRQILTRNVAEYVKIPRAARKEAKRKKRQRTPWDQDEVKGFLAYCSGHRLHAVMLLSLIGLRPAEVVGLRWMDVDLEHGTVRIEITRTLVVGEVVEKDTKSEAGDRGLPLPEVVWQALRAFHTRQLRERLKAGKGYEASGRVVVDDLGGDWKTDKLRREAYKLMASAGVRKTRLYDARHACLSWMANNGVPDTVVSAWAGHSDLSFTKRTYVHPDPQSLKAGSEKLMELLG